MEHLITFAISTLGKLTESLGPRVGTFAFFEEENWALIQVRIFTVFKKGTRLLRIERSTLNRTVISKLLSVTIKDKNEQRI